MLTGFVHLGLLFGLLDLLILSEEVIGLSNEGHL